MNNKNILLTNATTTAAANPADTPMLEQKPAKRKLHGDIRGLDERGHLRGNLTNFYARHSGDHVELWLGTENFGGIELNVDYVQCRAAVGSLRDALKSFGRFKAVMRGDAFGDLSHAAQLQCWRGSPTGCEDQEIRFNYLPQRDLIEMKASFSNEKSRYTAYCFLLRVESQALLHDLERALAELECVVNERWP
jgi:hypothetical protein